MCYREYIFSLFPKLPLLGSSLLTYPVFSFSSNFSTEENPKREDYFGITNLVEHPAQLNPPGNVGFLNKALEKYHPIEH